MENEEHRRHKLEDYTSWAVVQAAVGGGVEDVLH